MQKFFTSNNEKSEILILGSMLGVKSLKEQQYYAHPQNRFWKIMGLLCNSENLSDIKYEDKIEVILQNGFALWDVIKSCRRIGSLDSHIEEEIPNDIKGFLKKNSKIKKVCLNGNKSYSAFKKYFPELLKEYECYKLPSTSPANARYTIEKLYNEWKEIIK